MKDAIQRGHIVEVVESALTHPTHSDGFVDSGDAVLVGVLTGVAVDSAAAATDLVRVAVAGAVSLSCSAHTASANSAIAVGDKLYYEDSDTKAVGTLTSDATAPTDGDTVTIGSTVYVFKDTLSVGPAVPFEVLVGISAAVALDNLKSAINLTAGEGTTYATGTTIHPTVNATTNGATTQVVEANTAGPAGNLIATTEVGTHTSWGATTLVTGSLIGTPSKDSAKTAFGIALGALTSGANGVIPVKLKRTF